jgi:ComF family protein
MRKKRMKKRMEKAGNDTPIKIGKCFRAMGKLCLEILYPTSCVFCGSLKVGTDRICTSCRRKIRVPREPLCKKCGKPILHPEEEYCRDCSRRKAAFESGRSLWIHRPPVSDAVYRFKYHNCRCYAEVFAWEMWQRFEWQIYRWEIDVILPVPIHRSRRRKRGYNQAELLAKELSELSRIPVDTQTLVRVRKTDAQKNVRAGKRVQNLKGAFACISTEKRYQNVLVVDDIYTTGSTMQTIAEVLKEKGIKNVYFMTISIGQDF